MAEVESFATIMTPGQIQANVSAWDAAIIAAIASNAKQLASVPTYDFPLYIQLAGDCYTNGGTQPTITSSVVRDRTCTLLDYKKNPWNPSTAVTIYENIYQTSGTQAIVGDGQWSINSQSHFTDYLSVGGLNGSPPAGAIQQYYAVGSFVVPSIPLIILDSSSTKPSTYGTLGAYYQTTNVSINGDHEAGVSLCAP